MNCGQIQKMLPASLDGVLSKTESALVEKHLASCESCRTAFGEYQQARRLIGNLEEVEPPPGFAQRVMARVEEEEGKKAGIFRKLFYPLHIKVPIQAVAMAAVAVLAIQAYRAVEPQRQTAPQTGLTAAPESKEEPGKIKDRREEAVQPSKAKLPIPEQAARTGEETAKDTLAGRPAPLPPAETRPSEERAAAPPGQIPAGPAAPREAEKGESAAGGKKAKMETKTATPAPSPEAAPLKKKAEIGFRLQAANPATAGEKVQTILQEIGGRRIEMSPLGEGQIVTAELSPERLPLFLERLKSLGEIQEKPRVSEPASPFVSVRVEIFGK